MKTKVEQLREDIIRERRRFDAKLQGGDQEWITPVLEGELRMYGELNRQFDELKKLSSAHDAEVPTNSMLKKVIFWVFVFACLFLLWQVFERAIGQ